MIDTGFVYTRIKEFFENKNYSKDSEKVKQLLQANNYQGVIDWCLKDGAYGSYSSVKAALATFLFYDIFDGNLEDFLKKMNFKKLGSENRFLFDYIKGDPDIDIVIPANLNDAIEQGFFRNWEAKSLIINNPLKRVIWNAFQTMRSLKTADISGVDEIGYNAFEDCTALEYVKFGNNCTSVPTGCFKNCKSLTKIHLGKNINVIQPGAFDDCSADLIVEIEKPIRKIKMTPDMHDYLKEHAKWVN